ncbi:hypothetical protein [Streptomyces sp. NBC_00893]|uniref:hypothetical protein n=1 Tax=Streptomyces sp. NBC_00893 TaxID=2975862 RepID=UPI002250A1B2|nr:hypothetical protein [Streptomyces sp. NBC_00893]MCX4852035.1 hypothetical protein [Streptomyces sp. NBC_00893]
MVRAASRRAHSQSWTGKEPRSGTPQRKSATRHDAAAWLAWAITATALVSIVAVVILALTHNTEAATAVATIGGAVTVVGGTQAGVRSRQ